MKKEARKFVTHQAWIEGRWERDVVLSVADNGTWASVLPNASAAQQVGARRLDGAVLPGVVNAHSHAFQRTRAGLSERRSRLVSGAWQQPDRRLNPAQRMTPAQLESVASQLYAEMLLGGYTQVCEFLYVSPSSAGQAHSDPQEMAQALVRAAQRVGLGLTLLPTLPAPRMGAGFGASGSAEESEAAAADPERVMRVVDAINRQSAAAVRPAPGTAPEAGAAASVNAALVGAGVGLHGLNTVDAGAMQELTAAARKTGLPVHIHVAETESEVEACLAHTGQRPIDWLLNHASVDARWNLVHATHATPAELQGVRNAGAAVVLCPSTEANLGHGLFDLPGFAALGGNWSIGSDRHLARSWPEELRLLEYAHRLQRHERNVSAQAAGRESCAAVLFDAAVAGGRAATGQRVGPIQVGCRADFLVLDPTSPSLLGLPVDHQLDALLFSSPAASFSEVFVAGRCVVRAGRVVGPHDDAALAGAIGDAFVPVMQAFHAPGQAALRSSPRPD